MPKERIYDSFSPDEMGIELRWDKGTGEVLIGAARLDEDGKAAALAPPGTCVPVMLGLRGIERLQKTLDRIKRQAVRELKTARAVGEGRDVGRSGDVPSTPTSRSEP